MMPGTGDYEYWPYEGHPHDPRTDTWDGDDEMDEAMDENVRRLTRRLTDRERAVIAPPHPGDFGIPKDFWEHAQYYAEYWHENRMKAIGK